MRLFCSENLQRRAEERERRENNRVPRDARFEERQVFWRSAIARLRLHQLLEARARFARASATEQQPRHLQRRQATDHRVFARRQTSVGRERAATTATVVAKHREKSAGCIESCC